MNKCPACGSVDCSDNHLIKEYLDLTKHCLSKMFGRNAMKVQDEITEELLSRGITEIPNIFGPIKIEKWK